MMDSVLSSIHYKWKPLCLGHEFAAVSLGLPLPALSQELVINTNEGSIIKMI